ncbi:Uma2 family endonuclease [Roseofilum casamattae]
MNDPDISDIITEDDTPVDNLISEKQQRLLTSCLYSSFASHPFIAMANIGLFYGQGCPPLVPDVLLSLGVELPAEMERKENRSYFVWHRGKPPDVVIEIVSNKVGNELSTKLDDYATARVSYYVVFDPLNCLSQEPVQVYQLRGLKYHKLSDRWMEGTQLGLTLWTGVFEGQEYEWLRWCDKQGNLLLTGDEIAEQERSRAEQQQQRAERLAQLLREQGIDPDSVLE